jgi:phage host-nuclease inhibitor protein Gam
MHIKNTVQNAISLSKGIIDQKLETELKEWTINRLSTEMQNCQSGLINLKTTYNEDSLFKASIDVIIERLQAYCEELITHLDARV